MSELEDRIEAALAGARDALGKSAHPKKPKKKPVSKDSGHVHSMPDGTVTLVSEEGADHEHQLGGGLVSGPPVQDTLETHWHMTPSGKQTGVDMPAPASSTKALDAAGLLVGKLPVIKAPDAAFLLKRLRAGETAGLLSKRRRVAKMGDPQALVDQDGDVYRVHAVIAQGGPVQVTKAGLPGNMSEGVDPASAAAFAGESTYYYMPLRPLVVFDPPLTLKAAVSKDLDFQADILEFDEEAPDPEPDTPERHVRLVKHEVQMAGEGQEERLVFGVVLVPDETDAHGDFYDELTVRNAAHSFMENGGVRKIMHKGEALEGVTVLETYLTRSVETHKAGDEDLSFPVGTWMMAMRISNDELWAMVLKGEFTGFSMGGTAIRRPVA